jgi:hypothetical protein
MEITSERHMITLYFHSKDNRASPSFRATASHTIMARKLGEKRFVPRLACEMQPQDIVRIRCGERCVERVEHDVVPVSVVEVRLADTMGSFFVGSPGMEPCAYFEVCGALTPLGDSVVEVLHFQRFDRFREIVSENPALASCRDELLEAGYDTDLGVYGLGPGRLLVRAGLAQRTIDALRQRYRANNRFLKASNIVVSSEVKITLLEQVEQLAPRVNPVLNREVLELEPPDSRVVEKRTFATLTSASSSSVSATNSSTDVHIGASFNPRKACRKAMSRNSDL